MYSSHLPSYVSHGWGNGYVLLPKEHPLHGKSYDEIHPLIPSLNVHGGLTFSTKASTLTWEKLPKHNKTDWVVGFDTAHFNDDPVVWTKARVLEETRRLKEQLEAYKPSV